MTMVKKITAKGSEIILTRPKVFMDDIHTALLLLN